MIALDTDTLKTLVQVIKAIQCVDILLKAYNLEMTCPEM